MLNLVQGSGECTTEMKSILATKLFRIKAKKKKKPKKIDYNILVILEESNL